jgi:UDP-glucose 4-epimerase
LSNILVTGGAGFIGSCLSKRLINDGHDVSIIDNLSTGSKNNLPIEATFIEGDVSDRQLLDKLSNKRFDIIFHFSGQSSGEISFVDPMRDFKDNVVSTISLCDYMIKNKIKKIIYASSVTVYGDPVSFPTKENDMNYESIKSFYALGKAASENYLRLYCDKYNINPICLRLFTIYGPGQNMENLQQGIVSIFLAMIINSEKQITVKGSLERFRDLVHIDDLVEICVRIMGKNLPGYHILNIGTGEKTKVKEIIKYISDSLKKTVSVIEGNPTPGDFFGSQADIKNLKQTLNYTPKINSKQGITSFAQWYNDRLRSM